MTPLLLRRRAALAALPLLAACGGEDLASLDPPAPPPPADALPPPADIWTVATGAAPAATLRLTLVRGQPARGTLEMGGQRRPVTIAGLAVEDARGPRQEAVGQVFGLTAPEAFNGPFRMVGTGAAVAEMAMEGGLSLGNANGVLLRLRLAERGPAVLTMPGGTATATLGR